MRCSDEWESVRNYDNDRLIDSNQELEKKSTSKRESLSTYVLCESARVE